MTGSAAIARRSRRRYEVPHARRRRRPSTPRAKARACRRCAAPADAEPPAAGPTLRREVTVTGEIVRIGDLIENAGAVAEVAIFRAPDLGQTGSVPARRVAEAVRPHQIIGLDTRGLDEVAVTRASRAITAKEIEARLIARARRPTRARRREGAGDRASTTRCARSTSSRARLPSSRSRGSAMIRARAAFDAVIELPGAAAARRAPLRLTGTLNETFEAAVLLRAVAQGDTVKASDVTVERRPKSELAPAIATDGRAAHRARRQARAASRARSIRQADLMKPELVARNETVTIVFEVPGIMLTIRGKALGSGRAGRPHQRAQRAIEAHRAGARSAAPAASPSPPRPRAWRPAADPSNPQRKRAE